MRKHSVPLAQAFSTNFTSSTKSFLYYANGPSNTKVLKQVTIAKQKRFCKVSPEQQQEQEQEQEQDKNNKNNNF